ncbi:MAG TPA: hypothetical protein VGF98_11225 [Candidatus Tumulicola sp.]
MNAARIGLGVAGILALLVARTALWQGGAEARFQWPALGIACLCTAILLLTFAFSRPKS